MADSIKEWKKPLDDDIGMFRTLEEHRRRFFFKICFILACIVLTLLAMGIAVTWGPYDIGFIESYRIIWDHLAGNINDVIKDRIVIELRMPRIVGGHLKNKKFLILMLLSNPEDLARVYKWQVGSLDNITWSRNTRTKSS